MLLQFGEKNPGMTRVMVGDALVFENERLQQRMNLFFDKIESTLRQNLRETALLSGANTPTVDAQADASVITAFCVGRLQRFARSGFRRSPGEGLDHALALLLRRLGRPLNFEMAVTAEMEAIALRHQPHAACLVPERRRELTTEGGLDVRGQLSAVTAACARLAAAGCRVALFVDPVPVQLEAAAAAGANNRSIS